MSTATRGNGRGAAAYEREPEPARHDGPDLLERVVEATARERYTLEEVNYMAKAVHMSGLYGMTQPQALTLMLLAEADGQHPMHALRRYHLMTFGGRVTPSMKAEAMLADMMAAGWRHEWLTESGDRTRQEIHLEHATKCPRGKVVGFTEDDARKAKLIDGPNKEMWEKHRPNMLRARTVSNACRMLDPGIVLGVYTPEEVADMAAEERPGGASPARNRDELRSALADARRPRPAPAPEPADAPAPPQTFAQWLDARLRRFHEDAGRRLGGTRPVDPIPAGQVTNHLISDWLNEGFVREEDVKNARGTRDRSKMGAAIRHRWDSDPEGLAGEVDEYLEHKLGELAAERGVPLDGDGTEPAGDADEQQGMADEDPEGFAADTP